MHLAPLSLNDPEEWRSAQPVLLAPSEFPLHLQLMPGGTSRHWWKIIGASLAVHAVLLTFATKLPSFSALRERPPIEIVERRVPLYIPRDALTQIAKNKREVAKQVDVADLLSQAAQQASQGAPDRSVKQFEMPKSMNQVAAPKAPLAIMPEAPQVNVAQTNAPPIPGAANGLAAPPPPPKPSYGQFENLGVDAPPPAHPAIAAPKASVQSAINGLKQSGRGDQVILSDDSPTQGAAPTPGVLGQEGAQHAGVELKSDPQGVDMRPYLAQILKIVRGNWQRVIPQGVRTGTLRGKTVLEFIINRDGSIPKLVIADSSGVNALDLPAVHALSASNPLPPLPPGFKGEQVRLAFSFAYNMAAQ